MALLLNFLGGVPPLGQSCPIETRDPVVWRTRGAGQYTEVGDFLVSFTGDATLDCFGGAFSVTVQLTDGNPGATSGPASVSFNGNVDSGATYEVTDDGAQLQVTSSVLPGSPWVLESWREGTWVGAANADLWIGMSGFEGDDAAPPRRAR